MKKRTRITNPFYCGLTVRSYTEHTHKITRPLRAALITDLHSTTYGPCQEILLEAIRRQCPDLILMSGDIADHKVPIDGTLLLLEGLKAGYPCFYVSGNHEQWTGEMPALCKMFTEHGVTVLSGTTARLTLGNQALVIGGVDDPHAYTNSHHAVRLDRRWKEQFWRCCSHTDDHIYSILLSHRPELTKYYRDSGFDRPCPRRTGTHSGPGQWTFGPSSGLLSPLCRRPIPAGQHFHDRQPRPVPEPYSAHLQSSGTGDHRHQAPAYFSKPFHVTFHSP